jgi:hypothetical protein
MASNKNHNNNGNSIVRFGRRSVLGSWAPVLLTGGAISLSFLTASDKGWAEWPPPESATSVEVSQPDFWPKDPDYGYKEAPTSSDRKRGQWSYYGFQPNRASNAPPLREEEIGKPSGFSADLAWRLTIGDHSTKIAVLDSGIKWDEDDLINKAFINHGELLNHKPTQSDGSACGGTGDLAGFDCNGDGVLSVADYKDTVSLKPEASEGHPKGDKNQNGKLDAGDLILNYSDGVDDDNNGYTDDISGWDFLKDDNDPYDDTRYGHGTGEAKDSCAETNNNIGGAGVCPLCRFVPLRVGDSFIADVQDFAQAVTYATDLGVNIVQEALGTINNSNFAQDAMRYAWEHKVLIVASMADENSRHHNMPATNNFTMPVHAIVSDGIGGNPTVARSMLAFNACTNFGAQNFVSVPGIGCSSEATGSGSGIAGLIYSAAKKYGINDLSAGEAMQLFMLSSDDIDVAESRTKEPQYDWSQKGFDQRFGYGRVNAARAVEWVRDKRIPPDVNITSPTWFQNLYPSKEPGPVKVFGTVSAKRAPSYDIIVEWAPGVQPLDDKFTQLEKIENISGTVITGSQGEPLAQIDLSKIDPTHEADNDSPNGENKYTITLRVRAIAHYGGTIGDVPGELRRAYQVHEDPDLLPGFPFRTGASGESSPKLADMNGDGKREIIVADGDGFVHAYQVGTEIKELSGFPFKTKQVDGLETTPLTAGTASYLKAKGYSGQPGAINLDYARETFIASPAVADMDGDGKPEIVGTTWQGTIYVIDSSGKAKSPFPIRLPYIPSCPLDTTQPKPEECMDTTHIVTRGAMGSPVLVDMNGDKVLDIVQSGFDGKLHVLDGTTGKEVSGFPVLIHYDGRLVKSKEVNRILATPTVTDVNGDGIPDIMVGSNERIGEGGNSGGYYLIDGRGSNTPGSKPESPGVLPNWPITMSSFNLFPLVGEGTTGAGATADFDGDGIPELVAHGNVGAPMIMKVDPGQQNLIGDLPPNVLPKYTDADGNETRGIAATSIFGDISKANTPDIMFPLFAQPSIGDLDLDGTPDVVTSGGSLSLASNLQSSGSSRKDAQHLLGMWSGKTGQPMPASPIRIEDFTFFNNQAIADISGDGFPEVMTGSGGYFVHAVDACGREPEGWPKMTGQWVISTVAVGDLDGDGTLEAVTTSRDGWTYAWHTKGRTDGVIQWASFHHDNRNTGNYDVPLDQGVKFKDVGKMDCSLPSTPGATPTSNAPPPEAGGGCNCSIPGEQPARSGYLWLMVGICLSLVARVRRRTS